MYALKKRFTDWLQAVNEEIARVVVAAILGLLALGFSYIIPSFRTFLNHPFELKVLWLLLGFIFFVIGGFLLGILATRKKIRRLTLLAASDDLTQIYNSRELRVRLAEETERARRYDVIFSVVLIDIDGLKKTNDKHGYEAGDSLLREFAQFAKSRVRTCDILGRYRQGDEFLIIAPGTSPLDARIVAERIRGEIETYKFQVAAKTNFMSITFSAGITDYKFKSDDDVEKLLKRAEIALSTAKKTKNCVCVA